MRHKILLLLLTIFGVCLLSGCLGGDFGDKEAIDILPVQIAGYTTAERAVQNPADSRSEEGDECKSLASGRYVKVESQRFASVTVCDAHGVKNAEEEVLKSFGDQEISKVSLTEGIEANSIQLKTQPISYVWWMQDSFFFFITGIDTNDGGLDEATGVANAILDYNLGDTGEGTSFLSNKLVILLAILVVLVLLFKSKGKKGEDGKKEEKRDEPAEKAEEPPEETLVKEEPEAKPKPDGDPMEKLQQLKELHDMGALSDEEFEKKKKEQLGRI